jgi:hypothetical protein
MIHSCHLINDEGCGSSSRSMSWTVAVGVWFQADVGQNGAMRLGCSSAITTHTDVLLPADAGLETAGASIGILTDSNSFLDSHQFHG